MKDLIRTWWKDGFSLRMYDTNRPDGRGKTYIEYAFRHKGKVIFKGDDFSNSPMHAQDSLDTVVSLLTFLALGEHDVEADYFKDYTPAQLAWRDEFGERLQGIVFDIEERLARKRDIARNGKLEPAISSRRFDREGADMPDDKTA